VTAMVRLDTSMFHLVLIGCFQFGHGISCDGDACPSGAQALMQRSSNAVHAGVDDEGLLGQVRNRIVEAVMNGDAITPLETTAFQALEDLLENTTLPSLRDGHETDQSFINTGLNALHTCNANFDLDKGVAATEKAAVEVVNEEHKVCRRTQEDLKILNTASWTRLNTFWRNLVVEPKGEIADATAWFERGIVWFTDEQVRYVDVRSNHTEASRVWKAKETLCNSIQSSLEVGFCQWLGRGSAAKKSYNRCWTTMDASFTETKRLAMDSKMQRSTQYTATKKIQCYLKVLVIEDRTQAQVALGECQDLSPDVSIFDLVNKTVPVGKDVTTLGDLDLKPGDAEWENTNYENLKSTQRVTPCNGAGELSHLCHVDHHVQQHRCKACAAGTTNTAGDDALGEDTTCDM